MNFRAFESLVSTTLKTTLHFLSLKQLFNLNENASIFPNFPNKIPLSVFRFQTNSKRLNLKRFQVDSEQMPPKRKSLSGGSQEEGALLSPEQVAQFASNWSSKDAQQALYDVLIKLHDKGYAMPVHLQVRVPFIFFVKITVEDCIRKSLWSFHQETCIPTTTMSSVRPWH